MARKWKLLKDTIVGDLWRKFVDRLIAFITGEPT